jgi:hypothetical protein
MTNKHETYTVYVDLGSLFKKGVMTLAMVFSPKTDPNVLKKENDLFCLGNQVETSKWCIFVKGQLKHKFMYNFPLSR